MCSFEVALRAVLEGVRNLPGLSHRSQKISFFIELIVDA